MHRSLERRATRALRAIIAVSCGAALAWVLPWVASASAKAAMFFVAPTGSDANAGSLESPFATIQRGERTAAPGDTVYVRGGTYAMSEDHIARRRNQIAYVTSLDKSGEPGKPIRYWAYAEERPVFDYSAVKPEGLRVDAFHIGGSWLHLRGLEVIGMQVTIRGHTQSIGFENDGAHNIYERLGIHDGQAIGVYSVRGGDNLFLNCDAYRNHDFTSEDGKGGNVDGFGCHPPAGAKGNVFRGCRAWFNSDDGFDCIGARETVTFDHCWAFYNGFSPDFASLGDGNGFKAGGYGTTPAEKLPTTIPRHMTRRSLAARNKASGFYANHHPGGSDWIANTAYRNGTNFNMLARLPDNRTDIDGFDHRLRNNLAYGSRVAISRYDAARCDAAGDSFDMPLELTDRDFASLDESELLHPRANDGALPTISLLHPSDGSRLVDRGVDLGEPFDGAAPDVGAFER